MLRPRVSTPSSPNAPSEVLYITVLKAEDLLPANGRDSCDAYVTIRAMPEEGKHQRRTDTKLMTRDPEWNQSFTILLTEGVQSLEFKVCHSERVGRAFLGTAVLPVPAAGGDPEGVTAVLALTAGAKYGGALAALARQSGAPPSSLGRLHVQVARGVAEGAALTPRRTGLLRRAGLTVSAAAALTQHAGHPGGTGVRAHPKLATGAQPEPCGFLHIDVVRGRGLLPMDRGPGREAAAWTSDPFVTAQLLPYSAGAPTVSTGVAKATLTPFWDEELLLPGTGRATSVKLLVYDKDAVGTDDYMGELVLPLPPRPGPGVSRREVLTQGWYPLSAAASERESLATALRALGRGAAVAALLAERKSVSDGGGSGAAAGCLGEIYIRLSWGAGVRCADVNGRPALRPRLGTLCVRVHEARGLPPRFADRPLVTVRFEHSMGTTPAATATRDPVWPPGASEFAFSVTEPTSDVVLTVLDRDPILGDQIVGEVCLPLPLLLAPAPHDAAPAILGAARWARLRAARARAARARRAAGVGGVIPSERTDGASDAEDEPSEAEAAWRGGAAHRWAEILPRRGPGEALQRCRPKPERSLGALCFSVQLRMDCSAAFAYTAPDVLPPEVPPGVDTSNEFSLGALSISLGRMLDGIFMPLFAPLRTLLYLQSWQAPRLNAGLIAFLILGCLRFWFLMRALIPLWVALWPVLHGYVSYLIHQGDYVPLYAEEAADEAKARAASAAEQARRDGMAWEAQARALAAAREAADPNAAAAAASAGVGLAGAISSGLGNLFGSGGGDDSAAAMSAYKRIKGKLEYAHTCALYYADIFDRWENLFTWSDCTLSAIMVIACAVAGLAASAAATAVCLAGAAAGLGLQHVALAAGLACFWPAPEAMRALLESVDYYLSYIPVTLSSQCGGTGLAATIPAARRLPLSDAALVAQIERDAAAKAQRDIAAEEAARHGRGRLRHVSMTAADVASGEWFWRLLARAPTTARDAHVRMAARVAAAQRPPREWVDPLANAGEHAAAAALAGGETRSLLRLGSMGRPGGLQRSASSVSAASPVAMGTPRSSASGGEPATPAPAGSPAAEADAASPYSMASSSPASSVE